MPTHEMDQLVLETLAKHGSDLTKPHPITYYFYFPSRQIAQTVAERLEKSGFSIQEIAPAPAPWWKRIFGPKSWSCIVERDIVPAAETVFHITDNFNAIAAEFGGEYDGWESAVVK
jgi:hypothetical protein